jgi:hypothetical protein
MGFSGTGQVVCHGGTLGIPTNGSTGKPGL